MYSSSFFLVLNYQKVVGGSIKVVLYSSSKKVEEINFEMPRYSTVHGGTSNEALLTGVALFFFLSLRKHDIYRSVYVWDRTWFDNSREPKTGIWKPAAAAAAERLAGLARSLLSVTVPVSWVGYPMYNTTDGDVMSMGKPLMSESGMAYLQAGDTKGQFLGSIVSDLSVRWW